MPGRALILLPQRERAESGRLTLEALAAAVGLHPGVVEQFVTYGLLEPVTTGEAVVCFDAKAVLRLLTICRLREDLGINLPGVAVVLDLLERIDRLKRELANARRPLKDRNNDLERDE